MVEDSVAQTAAILASNTAAITNAQCRNARAPDTSYLSRVESANWRQISDRPQLRRAPRGWIPMSGILGGTT